MKDGGHLLTLLGNFIKLTDNRGIIGGSISAAVELASEKLVQKCGANIKYDWVLFRFLS